ncbi:hypothetical protein CFE53_02005 [Methanofervidicoccus sp. A16]|uniref:hypothetical protein n=1 Tax=Methanofervidicoccus sp. A16 TaxID=2607662 RepID=UPI0011880EDD|nr:hypothetical protein [Methanofervidicoccus sp. A16]AXI24991.1 hypothetical protein CFE53_02005 [Methanofervidicoccus sp. A16]
MNVKVVFILLSLLALTTVQIYGENLKIVDVWTSNVLLGVSTDTTEYRIDPKITPTILVKVFNGDSYQHDVILEVKSDEGSSWRSSLVPIPPRREEVISAELEFKEFGVHTVHISLLSKDGKVLASKKATIAVANPIDIVNISCDDSFINESEPDVEVCNSPWFTVTLRNNKYSQSDYNVEVWIAVVSQNFNKDASKYPNDKEVLYYGKKDSKVIYLAKGSEREIKFKIPPITSEEDTVKIQVHINVSGVHDYADGPAYTKISITDGYKVKYSREAQHKKFSYPVSLNEFQIVTTLNEDVIDILEDYYRTNNIEDVELEKLIKSRNYENNKVLPRIYLKDDPYLVITKLKLVNKFNDKSSVLVTLESNVDKNIEKVELDKFEVKEIYLPILLKYPENKLNVSVQSGIYKCSKENSNIKPIPVSPVYIESIEVDKGDGIYRSIGDNYYVDLFINKNCTLKITLKNCYNKALSGNLTVDALDLKDDIIECPSRLSFKISPHGKTTLYFPISFNTPVKGDIKFTVKANGALTSHSKILHFDVNNIKVDIKYISPYRVKVTLLNNEPKYTNLPVPSYENKFRVIFRNFMDKDISIYTWIVVRGEGDEFKGSTGKKFIHIPSKGERSVDFKLKFDEGFKGYLQVYLAPVNHSNLTLVVTKYITVYSPLSIEKLICNNSKVYGEIGYSHPYPKPIFYRYWYIVEKDNEKVLESKKYGKVIYPGEVDKIKFELQDLEDSEYILRFFVEIPDFVKVNNTNYPILLKRSIKVFINTTENTTNLENNTIPLIYNGSVHNNTTENILLITNETENIFNLVNNNISIIYNESEMIKEVIENISDIIKENKTPKGIIETIFTSIMGAIEKILSMLGL